MCEAWRNLQAKKEDEVPLFYARFTFGLRVRDEPTRPGGTGILPVRQRLEAGATQI